MYAGKPGAPEGPLEVNDITGDSCRLSWKPPKDNGGSPVSSYIVEKMDVEDGRWMPVTKFCRGESHRVPDLVKGTVGTNLKCSNIESRLENKTLVWGFE